MDMNTKDDIEENTELGEENDNIASESPASSIIHEGLLFDEALVEEGKQSRIRYRDIIIEKLMEVNKELWIVLSMFVIIGAMNYLIASQRILLGLYTLPTLFSAYFFGRRDATLTAFLSVPFGDGGNPSPSGEEKVIVVALCDFTNSEHILRRT